MASASRAFLAIAAGWPAAAPGIPRRCARRCRAGRGSAGAQGDLQFVEVDFQLGRQHLDQLFEALREVAVVVEGLDQQRTRLRSRSESGIMASCVPRWSRSEVTAAWISA
jgi:hypothetical protein